MLDSPSYEVKVLSTVLLRDARSVTCHNFQFLSDLTNVNIIDTPLVEFKSLLKNSEAPANDSWRTRLLDLFMYARENSDFRNRLNVNQQYVSSMIDSLCIS